MKKIALTLAAIAALSTAGFAASKRTAELRDLQPFYGSTATVVNSAAINVAGDTGPLTNYERLVMQQMFNETSDN
jgi:hypothetical protein